MQKPLDCHASLAMAGNKKGGPKAASLALNQQQSVQHITQINQLGFAAVVVHTVVVVDDKYVTIQHRTAFDFFVHQAAGSGEIAFGDQPKVCKAH